MVELLQRTGVFHSITPFPWLILSLLLNSTAITKCTWLPPSSNNKWKWFTFQKKTKEEVEKQKKKTSRGWIQGVCKCVSPDKWDFHASSHFSAVALSWSSKIKPPGSLLFSKKSQSCAAAWHPWAPERLKPYCLAHIRTCCKPTWEGGRVQAHQYWLQQGLYVHQLMEFAAPWGSPISLQQIYQIF